MSALHTPDPYDPHEPAHPPDEDGGGEPSETTPPDTLDAPRCACPRRDAVECVLVRYDSPATEYDDSDACECECHDPAPSLSDPYPWDALERAALDLATAADAAHDEDALEPDPAELEDEPDTSPDEVDPWDLIF